jgi:hypothetical protein
MKFDSNKIIKDNLLPRKEKPVSVDAVEKVEPIVVPAPVVNVITDNKEVIKAIQSIPKAKDLDISPLIDAVNDIPEAQFDLTPIVEAIKESKSETDLKPVIDALNALKDERADDRISELAEALKEALSELPEKMPKMAGGGRSSTAKTLNVSGTEINPATEEKQDDIITAIGEVSDGNIIEAVDDGGDTQSLGATGLDSNELRVQDTHTHLLKEILAELKINNQYLEQVVGDENRVTESDIEIK